MRRCTFLHGAAAGTVLALFVCATSASARQETLRWTHPAPETVDRFEIHWGLASRLYTSTVEVGVPEAVDGVYSYTLTVSPDDAIVYFAVTAVDADAGLVSEFSNERSRDEGGNPGLLSEGAWGSVVAGSEKFSIKKVGKSKLENDWVFAFGTDGSNAFAAQDGSGQTYTGTFVNGGSNGQKLTLTFDSISRTNLAAVLADEMASTFEGAPVGASILVETADLKAKVKQGGARLVVKGKLKLRMSSAETGERKGRLKLKHEGDVVIVE